MQNSDDTIHTSKEKILRAFNFISLQNIKRRIKQMQNEVLDTHNQESLNELLKLKQIEFSIKKSLGII